MGLVSALFQEESGFLASRPQQTCCKCNGGVRPCEPRQRRWSTLRHLFQLCPGVFVVGSARADGDWHQANQMVYEWDLGSSYVLEAINHNSQERESSKTAFLQPALKRGNLIVFQHSLAKKILFDENKSATGVSVNTAGKKYVLSAKKEVILSAGTFQSPQLLMVSGVGSATTLQKHGIPVLADRPGVGQNMWVSACHSTPCILVAILLKELTSPRTTFSWVQATAPMLLPAHPCKILSMPTKPTVTLITSKPVFSPTPALIYLVLFTSFKLERKPPN